MNMPTIEERLTAFVEAKKAHEQQAKTLHAQRLSLMEDFLKEHALDNVVIRKDDGKRGKFVIIRGDFEFHLLKKDGTASLLQSGYVYNSHYADNFTEMLQRILREYEPEK